MTKYRRIVQEDNDVLDDSQLNNNEIYSNLLELNDTNKSIASLEDDLIKTSETIYTIESIINHTKIHRNLTSVELKVINKTLEHFYTQINIPRRKQVSLESHNVSLATEGIGNSLVNNIRGLVSGVEWVYEAIVDSEKGYLKTMYKLEQDLRNCRNISDFTKSRINVSRYDDVIPKIKNEYSPNDIIDGLSLFSKQHIIIPFTGVLQDQEKILGEITDIVRSIWLYTSSKEVGQLNDLLESLASCFMSLGHKSGNRSNILFGINGGYNFDIIYDTGDYNLSYSKSKQSGNSIKGEIDSCDRQTADKIIALSDKLLSDADKRVASLVAMSKKQKNMLGWSAMNAAGPLDPITGISRIPTAVVKIGVTAGVGLLYTTTDVRRAMAALRSVSVIRAYSDCYFAAVAKIVSKSLAYIKESA